MQHISIKLPQKFGFINWRKKIKGDYPGSWNEMSRKQYVAVIDLLHTRVDVEVRNVRLVGIMLGIKNFSAKLKLACLLEELGVNNTLRPGKIKEAADFAAAEYMMEFWELFKFIEEDITLTTNLIPWINTGLFNGKLYGPDGGLGTLTAEEWMWVDRFYMDWREENDYEDLYRMVACMYRPKCGLSEKDADFTGDVREPFNINRIDVWVNRIRWAANGGGLLRFAGNEWVNKVELLAIMHWYESCRHVIVKQFDRVFTESNETASEDYGWPAVFMKIAQDGPFGNLDKVNGENINTVLLHMQVRAKEAEEFERKRKLGVGS
jgi:hypothetical protein